jgi:hypothetical protein
MKSCQATFCTPLKICQKWVPFIRKVRVCKFIENTLKIDHNGRNFNIIETIFAYGEYRKNFITLLKYYDRVLVLYGRIKASAIINYVQILSRVFKVRKINVKYVSEEG